MTVSFTSVLYPVGYKAQELMVSSHSPWLAPGHGASYQRVDVPHRSPTARAGPHLCHGQVQVQQDCGRGDPRGSPSSRAQHGRARTRRRGRAEPLSTSKCRWYRIRRAPGSGRRPCARSVSLHRCRRPPDLLSTKPEAGCKQMLVMGAESGRARGGVFPLPRAAPQPLGIAAATSDVYL